MLPPGLSFGAWLGIQYPVRSGIPLAVRGVGPLGGMGSARRGLASLFAPSGADAGEEVCAASAAASITETIAGKTQARNLNSILKTMFLSRKYEYAGEERPMSQGTKRAGDLRVPAGWKCAQVQFSMCVWEDLPKSGRYDPAFARALSPGGECNNSANRRGCEFSAQAKNSIKLLNCQATSSEILST